VQADLLRHACGRRQLDRLSSRTLNFGEQNGEFWRRARRRKIVAVSSTVAYMRTLLLHRYRCSASSRRRGADPERRPFSLAGGGESNRKRNRADQAGLPELSCGGDDQTTERVLYGVRVYGAVQLVRIRAGFTSVTLTRRGPRPSTAYGVAHSMAHVERSGRWASHPVGHTSTRPGTGLEIGPFIALMNDMSIEPPGS